MMNKAVIKRSRNKQFFFILVASNGNTIATSETYTRKHNCIKSVHTWVKKPNIIDETIIPRLVAQ